MLFPIILGDFSIDFGHICLAAVTLYATLLFAGRQSVYFWFFLGGSFDQIVSMVIRQSTSDYFYSTASIGGSLTFLLSAVIVFGMVSLRPGQAATSRPLPVGLKHPIKIFSIFLLLIIFGSRILQVVGLMLEIANEQRSFMLAGYEIHHINYGLILICLAGHLLYFNRSARINRMALMLLPPGIALIDDQISYYTLQQVTDAAYLSWVSYAGALTMMALQFCLLIYLHKGRRQG